MKITHNTDTGQYFDSKAGRFRSVVESRLVEGQLDGVAFVEGDKTWHDGPGWYYVFDDYPDEGSCGAFETLTHARESAMQATEDR